MLLKLHPNTKALAKAFANNILAGFAGESEEVDAANAGESEGSRKRAEPIEMPDGTKCYTENCERHDEKTRQTNNNDIEYAHDDNSRTSSRSEKERSGGAVQRAGQAGSHSEQGGDKEHWGRDHAEREAHPVKVSSERLTEAVQHGPRKNERGHDVTIDHKGARVILTQEKQPSRQKGEPRAPKTPKERMVVKNWFDTTGKRK